MTSEEEKKQAQFTAAITPHLKKLANYARRLSRNDDWEDLLQQSLLVAYSKFDYTNTQCRKLWLIRIVKLTWMHRRQKHFKYFRVGEPPEQPPSQEDVLVSESLQKWIRKAIATLPPKRQEVVRLVFFEGMTYQQVSTMLHMPERTVSHNLHRAKEQLLEAFRLDNE